ncbi:MAG TPA: hypothetical protein VJH23_00495 [archaeon]|nr:hypothetical protein [archaeon]
METVTISKKEYVRLKKRSAVDRSLVAKITRGLEDIRHGRISEWKQ